MARRRCFSNDILGSGAFCALPPRSQLLYIQMNMDADDDGVVANVRPAMAKAGARTRDIQPLLDQRFVLKCGRVYVIKHWFLANTIKRDRYHPTTWQEDIKHLSIREDGAYTDHPAPGAEALLKEKERSTNGTKMEPERNQNGTAT